MQKDECYFSGIGSTEKAVCPMLSALASVSVSLNICEFTVGHTKMYK
jgi:hypothetical protein